MSGDASSISQNICGLCDEASSKYCCPRCEVFYCSLNCYKSEKHATCSENFYQDCVNEELASYETDDESRHKMIDILKRMRNDDIEPSEINDLLENVDQENEDDEPVDSDDDEGLGLHERIENLNLDDSEAIWSVLTEDERNEFEALLSQGEVGSFLPQWEPWWLFNKEEKLVQDVNEKNTEEEEALKKCPVLKTVPKFSSLTTITPSPAIRHNITNVLASYVFVTRYFNGELDAMEAASYLLNICSNLDSNANFDDVLTAIDSVAQKCLQSDLIETDEVSLDVMQQDTFLLVQGPSEENKQHYCKAALSHIHQILTEAKSSAKTTVKTVKEKSAFSRKFPEHKTEHLLKLDAAKVKKCLKKVEYYLSYVESYGMKLE